MGFKQLISHESDIMDHFRNLTPFYGSLVRSYSERYFWIYKHTDENTRLRKQKTN